MIHPGQVPVVQRAFSPSAERAQWAARLVEAFEAHQTSGQVSAPAATAEGGAAGRRTESALDCVACVLVVLVVFCSLRS